MDKEKRIEELNKIIWNIEMGDILDNEDRQMIRECRQEIRELEGSC